MKLTTRCDIEAAHGGNEALLAKAALAGRLRTARLRADTTVASADVDPPDRLGVAGQGGAADRGGRSPVQAAGGAV